MATVTLSGQTQASASDDMANGIEYRSGASADAFIDGSVKLDSSNRGVIITSNLSTPANPTYHRDPTTHALVANVRQPDGSLTDDIPVPPIDGTAVIYHATLSGNWGKNSSFNWECPLMDPDKVPFNFASGTFNSTSVFGNQTQTIDDFSGVYYEPPASSGVSEVVTLTVTDGGDGAVAANKYTIRFHHPHAVPVNFRCTAANDLGNGVLEYAYAWDSSTGVMADLVDVTVKERISYDSNSTGTYGVAPNGVAFYAPPLPFTGVYENPQTYGDTPVLKSFSPMTMKFPSCHRRTNLPTSWSIRNTSTRMKR